MPRTLSVSLSHLTSARIPLHPIIHSTDLTSYDLLSTQTLTLLHTHSITLLIQPLVLPFNPLSYPPADYAALRSLRLSLDRLGFFPLCLLPVHLSDARFASSLTFDTVSPLYEAWTPLTTLRLHDLPTPARPIPCPPSLHLDALTRFERQFITPAPDPTPPADDPRRDDFQEPCSCCRRIDCVCPHGCANCSYPHR